MGEVSKASFSFENYIIRDATIHVSKKQIDNHINFKFEPKGLIDKEQKIFTLSLGTFVEDESRSFEIRVFADATFKYVEDENGNIREVFLIHNAPAILFPYIRAYISALSSLSGIPTILLPTINMSVLAEELRANLVTKE